jgi:hypothetical protein
MQCCRLPIFENYAIQFSWLPNSEALNIASVSEIGNVSKIGNVSNIGNYQDCNAMFLLLFNRLGSGADLFIL